MGNKDEQQNQGDLLVDDEIKVREPHMYRVILLNDDFTPMDFVVMVLEKIFHLAHEQAIRIMLNVHQQGKGICGVYTLEVAKTKTYQVIALAKQYQHPLQCTFEQAD